MFRTARCPRAVVTCVVGLSIALLPAGAGAQQKAATVDQVLTALAEVVKERAELVATRTIVRKLKDKVCSGTLDLKQKKPTAEGKDPQYDVYRTLYLGGTDKCKKDGGLACNSDDVFADSCRLIEQDAMTLTDPAFLKTLTREVVSLLIRVAAGRMERDSYEKLGFPALAKYVHNVMQELVIDGAQMSDLARPTLVLAEDMSPGMPRKLLANLGNDAATRVMLLSLEQWINQSCKADPGGEACSQLAGNKVAWFPGVLSPSGAPVTVQCDVFMSEEKQKVRRALFDKLFRKSSINLAPPFENAEERSCADAGYTGAQLVQCNQARMLINLNDHLTKLVCFNGESSDDFQSRGVERKDLRQLGYLLAQRATYQAAIKLKPLGLTTEHDLDAFLSRASTQPLDELPREELANGIRLLGAVLQAKAEAPKETAQWLVHVREDARRFLRAQRNADFIEFVNSSSLSSGAAHEHEPEALRDLRDSARDFLVLPLFQVYGNPKLEAASAQARNAAVALMAQLGGTTGESDTPRATLRAVSEYVSALALLTGQLQEAVPAADTAKKAQLAGTSRALTTTSTVLKLAADKDWMGLAVNLTDELRTSFADEKAVSRPTTFVRTLLSMYQAPSVEEAKSIFKATLVDEASRERRYDATTLDVAALVGVRGGYQQPTGGPPGRQGSGIYGLYAPFGIQWARKGGGLLLYPVDLGTYLVAQEGAAADAQAPRWHDALRLGLTGYLRPWGDVPLVFGVGADYRMKVVGDPELRFTGHLSLELPLYTLY